MSGAISERIERLGDAAWLVRCDRPGCDYFAWTARRAFFSGHPLSVEARDAYLAGRLLAHEEEKHSASPRFQYMAYDRPVETWFTRLVEEAVERQAFVTAARREGLARLIVQGWGEAVWTARDILPAIATTPSGIDLIMPSL